MGEWLSVYFAIQNIYQKSCQVGCSRNYSAQEVYNTNEIGLNFNGISSKVSAQKILACKKEFSASGFKMLSSRATGTNKLLLMAHWQVCET